MQMNAYGGAQFKRFSPVVNFHLVFTDKICRVEFFSFGTFLVPYPLGHKKERVIWKLPKYLKSITIVKSILLIVSMVCLL